MRVIISVSSRPPITPNASNTSTCSSNGNPPASWGSSKWAEDPVFTVCGFAKTAAVLLEHGANPSQAG